jgi:divalent metal cation (Fe/Co/Zn/Cd) transporter
MIWGFSKVVRNEAAIRKNMPDRRGPRCRDRWVGNRLRAEVSVEVEPELPVEEGHAVARKVNHRLLHHLRYLDAAVVYVDPVQETGEEHHRIGAHSHDGLPPHSH